MALSSKIVEVKGRPTEVLTAGQGEPLVLLHGGGIIEGFDVFEPLADRFSLIAPMRAGYGATDLDPPLHGRDAVVDDLRDVLDVLAIERTILVGHSLGGWLAATFAARFPERVSALVLAAPWGMSVPEHPLPDLMSMGPAERVVALTNDPSIFEGRFPSGPDPVFEAARAREGDALRRFMPGPNDPELPGIAAQISAPTLLLWGEDDGTMPAGYADVWQKAIPQASLRMYPDTGHLLFHERTEPLEALVAFAEECSGASG